MLTSIQIPLDPEIAEIYNRASSENQRKLQALIHLWLRHMDTANPTSLRKPMDEISDKAKTRGLNPDMLES